MLMVSGEMAERHYAEHVGKPSTTTSSSTSPRLRSSPWWWRARRRSASCGRMMGATNPLNAAPGTVRGDFGAGHGAERGPQLRQPGERRAGDRALLPRGLVETPSTDRRGWTSGPLSRPISGFPGLAVAAPAFAAAGHWACRSGRGDLGRRDDSKADRPRRWPRPTRWPKCARPPCPPDALDGAFVLGTDTLVTLAGRVMGKPASRAEARGHDRCSVRRGPPGGLGGGAAAHRRATRRAAGERPVEELHVATAHDRRDLPRLEDAADRGLRRVRRMEDKAGAYAIQGLAGLFVVGDTGGVQQRGRIAAVSARASLPASAGSTFCAGSWSIIRGRPGSARGAVESSVREVGP